MTTINLSTPLPGIGYAINAREYLMNAYSLDTDATDGFFYRGGKTFLNTAIRCTSFSLPYLTYISCSNITFFSHYANILMGLSKGVYSGYSAIQGYLQNDAAKKDLAKKMAKEAALHAIFAYVDRKVLELGAKVIVPVITTYVGAGVVFDLFGQSKNIHNRLFRSSEALFDAAERSHGLPRERFPYPVSPDRQSRFVSSSIITRLFSPASSSRRADSSAEEENALGAMSVSDDNFLDDEERISDRGGVMSSILTRLRHVAGTPFPRRVVDSATRVGRRVTAEVRNLLAAASPFLRGSVWNRRAHNGRARYDS